jgi:serine/threonine protein kinase
MRYCLLATVKGLFFAALLLTATNSISAANKEGQGAREKAKYAASKLYKLMPKAGLSQNQFYRLAHFIETKLSSQTKKHGNYIDRKKSHLRRSLERDPKTGDVYIHLGVHGGLKRLGKGTKKIVTHSILYHPERPQRMAQCETKILLKGETKAIKALKGVAGLAQVKSILTRKSGKGRKTYSFMCKLYNAGSLNHVIKYTKLSKKQKLELTADVLRALSALHAHDFVHRDICPQNFLVEKAGDRYSAVLADLGRTMKAQKAVGLNAQGHRFFLSPETLSKKKLKKENYFMSDVYATGCTLYKLFYGKEAPWVRISYVKDRTQPLKKRTSQYKSHLTKFHKKKMSKINQRLKKSSNRSRVMQTKALIMRMVHPNPNKRGTASELHSAMQKILDQTT